jgi:hypothetical protein
MMKYVRIIIISSFLFSGTLFAVPSYSATKVTGPVTRIELTNPIGGTDAEKKGQTNTMVIFGLILKQALTIVGSVAFVVFLVGGGYWLISAGNSERVKKGTETMVWAAIGLFVIFASYGIVSAVIGGLTGKPVVDGGGGAPASASVTYYIVGENDAKVWAEPKENVTLKATIGKTVDCVPGSGKEKEGYLEVTDPVSKAVGWVKSSNVTKSTNETCAGPAAVTKTKCETDKEYKDTHSCQDTTSWTATQTKDAGCVSNLCSNSVLMSRGISKAVASKTKCCVKPEGDDTASSGPKTTCETDDKYSADHVCIETKGWSSTKKKENGCVSNKCQSAILVQQKKVPTKTAGNSWKCCIDPNAVPEFYEPKFPKATTCSCYGSLDIDVAALIPIADCNLNISKASAITQSYGSNTGLHAILGQLLSKGNEDCKKLIPKLTDVLQDTIFEMDAYSCEKWFPTLLQEYKNFKSTAADVTHTIKCEPK